MTNQCRDVVPHDLTLILLKWRESVCESSNVLLAVRCNKTCLLLCPEWRNKRWLNIWNEWMERVSHGHMWRLAQTSLSMSIITHRWWWVTDQCSHNNTIRQTASHNVLRAESSPKELKHTSHYAQSTSSTLSSNPTYFYYTKLYNLAWNGYKLRKVEKVYNQVFILSQKLWHHLCYELILQTLFYNECVLLRWNITATNIISHI